MVRHKRILAHLWSRLGIVVMYIVSLKQYLPGSGRLLNDSSLEGGVRVGTLRCLAACALREDVSLLLHQDRRHHALLRYAYDIDRRDLAEQRALALVVSDRFHDMRVVANAKSDRWR